MMNGYGFGYMGWLPMFFGAVVLVGLVLLIVLLVRSLGSRGEWGTGDNRGQQRNDARRILDERYARGELTTAEYEERVQVLGKTR